MLIEIYQGRYIEEIRGRYITKCPVNIVNVSCSGRTCATLLFDEITETEERPSFDRIRMCSRRDGYEGKNEKIPGMVQE